MTGCQDMPSGNEFTDTLPHHVTTQSQQASVSLPCWAFYEKHDPYDLPIQMVNGVYTHLWFNT